MYFLFSGEGATDLGECADSAAICEGNDCRHGPMTVIVDQIIESQHHYSLLDVGCCGFVSRGTLVDRASELKTTKKGVCLPGKKRGKRNTGLLQQCAGSGSHRQRTRRRAEG